MALRREMLHSAPSSWRSNVFLLAHVQNLCAVDMLRITLEQVQQGVVFGAFWR